MDLTTRIKIWLGACAAATGDEDIRDAVETYAAILEGCSGEFFNSMRKKLNPEERWKSTFQQIEGWN